MSDDAATTAELRDGEIRDDTHASRNAAQLREARAGDTCPDCAEARLEGPNCPTCPNCGWSRCYGGDAYDD